MHKFKVGDKMILKGGLRSPLRYNEDLFKYMGTVREVIDIDNSPYGQRIKLAGCIDWRGNSLIFWPEDLLPVPEIGDKVKIRSWEDMEDQYGLDGNGDINANGFLMVRSMKEYCGETIPVCDIETNAAIYFEGWAFLPFCFEEVYKKEDGKVKFTKKDLKNGMTVKINGEIFLVNGDSLMCSNGYMRISDYNDDLSYPGNRKWDIQDVCDVNPGVTGEIRNILEQRGKLLWMDEKKEIPISEALEILREKFGCEVKLVTDK